MKTPPTQPFSSPTLALVTNLIVWLVDSGILAKTKYLVLATVFILAFYL